MVIRADMARAILLANRALLANEAITLKTIGPKTATVIMAANSMGCREVFFCFFLARPDEGQETLNKHNNYLIYMCNIIGLGDGGLITIGQENNLRVSIYMCLC